MMPMTTPASADHACPDDASTTLTWVELVENGIVCGEDLLDNMSSFPLVGVSLEIKAPDSVIAGDRFSVVAEATLEALGASIVQFLPTVVVGPCTLTKFSIQGGVPLGANYYFLTSNVSLPYLVNDGDPPEYMNGLDMHMTFDTTDDSLGDCRAGAQVVELADQLAGFPWNEVKELIPVTLHATPLDLGKIETKGGHGSINDGAHVIKPALIPEETGLKFPILVLQDDPEVAPLGLIGHVEEWVTWYDDGYFELRKNGARINKQTLSQPKAEKVLEAKTGLPHEKGKTIDTQFCLYGVYIDGGVGEDKEGPAQTCMVVAATTPSDSADLKYVLLSFGSSIEAACATFALPTTQAAILLYGGALVPIAPLADPTKAAGPTGHYLFGPEFGEDCP